MKIGTMNDEAERMGVEAVVAYFKVLGRHLAGDTEEKHEVLVNVIAPRQGFEPTTSCTGFRRDTPVPKPSAPCHI
jgi:hypothetical protein